MIRRRWKLALTGILVAGALISLDAYRRLHDAAPDTRDALLSKLPGDASAVFFLNFSELRESPFAAEFYNWIPKTHADAQYSEFLRRTSRRRSRRLTPVAPGPTVRDTEDYPQSVEVWRGASVAGAELCFAIGRVAERLMAADCKSAAPCGLRRFESSPVHQFSSGGIHRTRRLVEW